MIYRNAILAIRLGLTVALLCCIGYGAHADETEKPSLWAPKRSGIYIVAHRGAHQGTPENRLAAYEKAIELGVDFVEIDVAQLDVRYVE